MYAYGLRNVGNPELHKAFEKRIDKIVEKLDYPSLFNAIYYLLFRENGNKQLWQKIVKTTVQNPDVLPIIYYRPFKAAALYLKGRFPELKQDEDFEDFEHKFWYSERYYNVWRQEDYITSDPAYYNFKGFLNGRCLVYPISFLTVNNLFLLHFVFNEQKIAINYHLEKLIPSEKTEPTEMQKLASKVLKHHGWEVLDLSE